MRERSRPKAPIWSYGILFFILTALYLPIVVMIVSSFFKQSGTTDDAPWAFSFEWYQAIFADAELLNALMRSLFVGLGSAFLSTILGGVAAVALLRSTFRFSWMLEKFSYLTLIVPELVFALSLLSWFFILGLQLSLFTVMVAHITFSLSFVIMTVNGRLATLDVAIEDAGRDLGASEWVIFTKIILPLLKPAFFSAFLLSFLLSFDDFLITFFTIGIGTDTLPIKLYSAMKAGLTPRLSALATLMFLMSVVVITFFIKARGVKALIRTDSNAN